MNTSLGHTRRWIALLIGFGAGLCCTLIRPIGPETHVDIGWAINAARDLLAGQDPYRYSPSPVLVPYPLTAAIIVFPWALLPAFVAQILCFGMISGILAYGLLRDGEYWRLLVFVSPSFLIAMGFMQWSPLFLAVLYYPVLAPVLLAKPTLALPIAFSIRWTRWQITGACLIGLLSLVALPDWPVRWLRQIQAYGGFIPLVSFLGPVFLLSLMFWRNQRARFFFFLLITPQHRMLYDQLLLWAIPQTPMQMIILTGSAWIMFLYVYTTVGTLWAGVPALMLLVYLPAFCILLWQLRKEPLLQAWSTKILHIRARNDT